MFVSLATTHRPASDLGFLLMKHPDRAHEFDLAFGKAVVFFPRADEERCEAVLTLDVDPVGLVRRGDGAGGEPLSFAVDQVEEAACFAARRNPGAR